MLSHFVQELSASWAAEKAELDVKLAAARRNLVQWGPSEGVVDGNAPESAEARRFEMPVHYYPSLLRSSWINFVIVLPDRCV